MNPPRPVADSRSERLGDCASGGYLARFCTVPSGPIYSMGRESISRKVVPVQRLLLIIVILSAALGAAIAVLATQKQRLAPMSPADRRMYLHDKLGSRLTDEQLDKLAEMITAKLDAAADTAAEIEDAVVVATEAVSDDISPEAGA